MDESQEERARDMVDQLKSCPPNYGLLVMGSVVVMRGPGTPFHDSPTMFEEADLKNAIALGLLKERRMVGHSAGEPDSEWVYYVAK
jgi:uncharacterized iron-regulated protein